MAGAYVAKPAAETEVDYPDGWNPRWPFPGPWPPGYTPSITTPISGTTQIAVTNPVATINMAAVDQGSYATPEPKSSNIAWSSTKEYTGGPSGTFASIGDDFWGDGGVFTFEDVGIGDTITVSTSSDPFNSGENIIGSHEIEVVGAIEYVWKVRIDIVASLVATGGLHTNSYAYWETIIRRHLYGDDLALAGALVDQLDGAGETEIETLGEAEATAGGGYAEYEFSGSGSAVVTFGSAVFGTGIIVIYDEDTYGPGVASATVAYTYSLYRNGVIQETGVINHAESVSGGYSNAGHRVVFTFNEDGTYEISELAT